MACMKEEIKLLANKYRDKLAFQVSTRVNEMDFDETSHYLIYQVLGISTIEGRTIDIYQNKARFLYKYAGSFLEEATFLCFKNQYPSVEKKRIKNEISIRPKHFEIDCLLENDAIEIKWRDATTGGDHTEGNCRWKLMIIKR